MKLKFEDFENEKLSKNQQKIVTGGDPVPPTNPPVDPGKGTGVGGNN